MTLCIQVLYVI